MDFGDELPSEVLKRRVLVCFIDDQIGLKLRHDTGIENIAWECDYPHSDSTWPRSPEQLWGELQDANCSDADIEAITWQSACRFFRFDPFAAMPREQVTVGALRARAADVDVEETSKTEYRRRWALAHAGA
jgi:hypothetical protein